MIPSSMNKINRCARRATDIVSNIGQTHWVFRPTQTSRRLKYTILRRCSIDVARITYGTLLEVGNQCLCRVVVTEANSVLNTLTDGGLMEWCQCRDRVTDDGSCIPQFQSWSCWRQHHRPSGCKTSRSERETRVSTEYASRQREKKRTEG